MIIDENILIDISNTNPIISTSYDIDTSDDTNIFVNGLIAVMNDDIIDITDNQITLTENLDIDYDNDVLIAIYTILE